MVAGSADGTTAGRRPELDGIRGAAILLVLLFHYGDGVELFRPGTLGAYLLVPLRLGWSGVDLFFVLSGFLIGGLLLDNRSSPCYFTTFFGRRACRILPVFIPLFALFAAGCVLQNRGVLDFPRLFGNVTGWPLYGLFATNAVMIATGLAINFLSVTWSLAIEEQFYLVAPWLVRKAAVSARVLAWSLGLSVIGALGLRILLGAIGQGWAERSAFLLPFARADALCLGTLVAVLVRHRVWSERTKILAWASLVASSSAVALVLELKWRGALGTSVLTILALFYAAVLVLTLQGAWGVRAVFMASGLRWLGDISYGLYLVHIPVLGVLAGLWYSRTADLVGKKPAWITLVAALVSLFVAWILRIGIEERVQGWGRKTFRY